MSDPSSSSASGGVAALAESFLERYRRGERPALTEYTARYPELADEILLVFPAMVEMEQLGPMPGAGDPAGSLEGQVSAEGPAIRRIGDYLVIREVGRGGMGVVYEAEQESLGRHVALKVLPRQVSQDLKTLARFHREARSAAQLHHTNIVPVFEVGKAGEVSYYAMQFIQGQGLDLVIDELRRLKDCAHRTRPAKEPEQPDLPIPSGTTGPARSRARQVSRMAHSLLTGRFVPGALGGPGEAEVAGAGRDASGALSDHLDRDETEALPMGDPSRFAVSSPPSSVVLPGGSPLSAVESGRRPFYRSVAQIGRQVAGGLAYAHARGIVHRDIKPSNLLLDTERVVWITDFGLAKASDEGLTQTGDILGTVRYMAPERFRGEGDGRADVYALGLTLYELLTLRPAFDSPDRLKLIEQIKAEDPPRPRALDPHIPRDLETIVLKAIAKDPQGRYPSADALGEDLRRFLADEPIRARRVGPLERAWIWAKRRPATAALLLVSGVAALALVGAGVAFLYSTRLEEKNRELAQASVKTDRALAKANRALDEAEFRRYFQRMALANTAWRDGSLGRLEQLLDECPVACQDRWEWRYLKRQCHRESLRLEGHTGAVFEIKYSLDGTRMASASLDYTAGLWDTATGRRVQTFIGHENAVVGVAFCPKDETRLATTGWDGTVRIWDATTGREVDRFDCGPTRIMLWDVAYSPDGERIAAAGTDGTVRVWDLTTRKLAEWTGGHVRAPFGVRKVRFSPDGKSLASTGANGKVTLWDATTGRVKFPLKGHGDGLVNGVVFSQDGTYLATASFDRTVRIWEVKTGQPAGAHVLRGHDNGVWGVAFSRDGQWLASSSADPSVKLWDWKSGTEVRTLKCHGGAVHDVAFSPDGTRLATASHDLTIKLWDLAEVPEARILAGHTGAVNGVAFHPAGRVVASAGQDKTIRLWDVATGQVRILDLGLDAAVLCVAFSPGGKTLASGDMKGVVRLWDTATGRMIQALPDDHGGAVAALAFRPDGKFLAVAGKDGAVRIWEVKSLQKIDTYPNHLRAVTTLAYSPDGRYLASGGEDRQVIVRDATGRVTFSDEGHTCFVHSVAYSPDGRYFSTAPGPGPQDPIQALLVSVSGDGTLLIWDTATNQNRSIKAHGSDVWSVAFSPDGTRLASASLDLTIRLWDVAGGDEVLSLRGHTDGVLGLAFSPDGNLLASAGRDGTVRIWDAKPWTPPSRN